MTSRPPSGPNADSRSLQPSPQGSRRLRPYDANDAGHDSSPTTLRLAAPQKQGMRSFGHWLGWTRTLRWRLLLIYVGTLLVLLVILGIVLDVVVGSVLYQEERARFTAQVLADATVNQRFFDQEVSGTGVDCVGAISYQQAFEDTIAEPLTKGLPAITAVYLLDRNGSVLAPGNTSVTPGETPPYFDRADLAQIRSKIAVTRLQISGTGYLTSDYYEVEDSSGQRLGVMLVAIRYYTSSRCTAVAAGGAVTRNDIGIIQVVTNYARLQAEITALHLVLILVLLGALVIGIAVGGPLTVSVLRPLGRMTETARRIAGGDLTLRVRLPHGGDEIGQLADTFDLMISRIERAFSAQHASEERMRQFIADASHELRTPLTSIRGYTDVLLRGAKDEPEVAEQVLLATRREAERMSRLVNDLLTLARLDSGRPLELQALDLVAIVGEAVDQARVLAGEHEVTMRNDTGGRVVVLVDPDRIKQVLLILLDNALKYGRQDSSSWVRVRIGRTQHGVFISISDNGFGISPEDLPHIFDRFYRAQTSEIQRHITLHQLAAAGTESLPMAPIDAEKKKPTRPKHEGSGLGLPIAQAIIRAHGGTITVESRLDVGTTFTIQLPLSENAAPRMPRPR
ncbi:MAG: sensor histidine kinase [Ktedonobacterales bacterium]